MSNTTKIAEAVAAVGARRLAATLTLSAAGLTMLQGHEAVVHKVYRDTTGTPTVCMGHTGNGLPQVGTVVTKQFCDDANLAATLLKAAQVDEAGGDDLAGADAGDPADRDEHAALAGDLDHEADDARRLLLAVDDEHVAHLADLVAGGVENGAPGKTGYEDSRGAHRF